MKRLRTACFITVLAVGGVDDAAAATFNTAVTQFGAFCDMRTTSSVAAESFCAESAPNTSGEGEARAAPGALSARAAARSAQTGADGTTLSQVDALASFDDLLLVGVEAGVLELSLSLNGDFSGAASGPFASNPVQLVRLGVNEDFVEFKFVYGFDPVAGLTSTTPLRAGSLFPAATAGALAASQSFGTTVLTLPFSAGAVLLSASMLVIADCGFEAASCELGVDFTNGLRFLGAVVRDADGNLVETTVTASSGFNYLTGEGPPVSAVPLPPAALSLLAGLAALAGLARRRVTPPSARR